MSPQTWCKQVYYEADLRNMPVKVFMTMAFGSIVTFARQKSDKVEHEADFEQLYEMLWAAMKEESHEED